ncbi:MAG: hypothetical protein QM706_09510 [Nitrospira sp.]
MLAIVSYPTDAETEANFDRLTDQEQQDFLARKKFLMEWDETSLKSAAQLPELQGDSIIIEWDMVGREWKHERLYTVLRHETQELWRERACWEGYERFQEIVNILKEKYGHRLLDVVPTKASSLYLYGDSLRAIELIQDIRKSFSKLRLIRSNLSSSWVLAQQLEQEVREG